MAALDEIVIGVILCTSSLIFGSILTYFLYQFHQLKNEMVIIKRRGDIVIKSTICAIICFFLSYPYTIILIWEWNIISTNNQTLYITAMIIQRLVYIPGYV